MQKIIDLQKQIKQIEKQIADEKTKIKKRMPTEYRGEKYQTYTDLWRAHFDLKIPYNRFFEALKKNPHLSIDDAVATVIVRLKTLETLKLKKRFYVASYLEGDCLDDGAYGIDLVVYVDGEFLRITKNFETNKISVEKTAAIEVDDSFDDLSRLEREELNYNQFLVYAQEHIEATTAALKP